MGGFVSWLVQQKCPSPPYKPKKRILSRGGCQASTASHAPHSECPVASLPLLRCLSHPSRGDHGGLRAMTAGFQMFATTHGH